MPDFKKEIRERLAGLRLAPTREAEIVEELAQHFENTYEDLLASGSEKADAWRKTLDLLDHGDLLTQELRKVERAVNQEPVVLGTRRINLFWDCLLPPIAQGGQSRSTHCTPTRVIGFASKSGRRAWRMSVPSAVADGSKISTRYFLTILTPIVDPSATADGTDLLQARSWTFKAKPIFDA